jgi:peptidoglycan L-alanyl-D-glutamate endopeptidase CwlK
VFALTVLLYFFLAIALASLIVFAGSRAWLWRLLVTLSGRTRQSWIRLSGTTGRGWPQGAAAVAHVTRSGVGLARRHWLIALAALAALALPVLIALGLSNWRTAEGFDDTRVPAVNAQVLALLQGEQLVPPPPLPPAVFMTREVELVRPLLAKASRDWNLLDPDFRQRLLWAFKIMKDQHGYEMVMIEGYRSPERQSSLQQMGAHVTGAGAYQSYHQYGLAADSAFFRDGRLVISEQDAWAMRGYELFGQTAESVGLNWGGRWKLKDFGHTEMRKPGVLGRKH